MNIQTPKKSGGKRAGAGRKDGTGKFRESTTVIRIPTSLQSNVKVFLAAYQREKLIVDLDGLGDFELPFMNAKPIRLDL